MKLSLPSSFATQWVCPSPLTRPNRLERRRRAHGRNRSARENTRRRAATNLNAARQTLGTASLADKRKAGDLPFGYYADGWLKSMDVKVSRGALKETTAAEYRRSLRCYVMDQFGGQAAASIAPRHCEDFLADLVGRVAVEVGSRYRSMNSRCFPLASPVPAEPTKHRT